MKKSLLFLFILGILNLIYSSSTNATGLANTPWPAYNGGGKLQGRNQYSGSNVYRTVKWVHSFGSAADGDSDSYPALATDGTIYVGTRNTSSPKLYAINPSDGSVKWSYSLGSQMRGSVAVDDNGNIYFGADKFYSLDGNGNLNWSNSSGVYTMVYPNIDIDGTIYTDVVVTTNKIRVRAFNSNGTVKWTSADYVTEGFDLGLHPPAYDNTYVYIVGNNKLIAVNKTDGSTAWTNTNVKTYTGHVAIGDNGYLYTAYWDNAWAVNSTGTEIWHNTGITGSNDEAFPSIGYNGTLYDGKYDVPRRVVAYDKDNGQILWEYSMEGKIWSASISVDRNENLYFGEATSGKATIINSAGSFKWSYRVFDSSSFGSTIAVSNNGEMYLGNYNYKFYGWKPWTLAGSTDTTHYHPGNTVTITATSSMLKTDPTVSEDNQVQVIMPNDDKVTLSYVSSANGETTWSGTYTIPQETADGEYTATVEAGAVNVQTDLTTHFTTAPTGSSNTGITNTFTYTVDSTAPTSGTVSINSGNTITASKDVTLTLSATDTTSSVTQMLISNTSDFDGTTWETYATTKFWTLTSGDGTKTVYIKYKDSAGNISEAYSDTIILDTTVPAGTISINSAATYTTAQAVTLTITATDNLTDVTQMKISESDVFTGATWETYSTTKSWTLASGDGAKTIYIKFRDGAGNESTTYSDTIILDTTKPVGTIVIEGGLKYINKHEVRLTLTLTDTNSADSQMMVSENATFAGSSWETFSNTKTFTLSNNDGLKTIYLKLKDAAGNESITYSSSITVDTTLPTLIPTKLNSLTFKPNIYSFYYTSGKNLTISGTTEPLATITIIVNSDPKTCTTTADAQGNFSCTF